jgi:hypothetical protein
MTAPDCSGVSRVAATAVPRRALLTKMSTLPNWLMAAATTALQSPGSLMVGPDGDRAPSLAPRGWAAFQPSSVRGALTAGRMVGRSSSAPWAQSLPTTSRSSSPSPAGHHRCGCQYRPDTQDDSGPGPSDDGAPCAFCRATCADTWQAMVSSVPPWNSRAGVASSATRPSRVLAWTRAPWAPRPNTGHEVRASHRQQRHRRSRCATITDNGSGSSQEPNSSREDGP